MSEKQTMTVSSKSEPFEEECARLREFKDFLKNTAEGNGVGASGAGAESMRNCVARSSNETYRVSAEERQAEVISTIWSQFQLKGCPHFFQIKLMHAVISYLEQEFRNSKECETNVNETCETQYDLLKLQRFVVNNMRKLLTSLTDNSAAEQLKNYADEGVLCANGKKCQCILDHPNSMYSVGHIKNKPRKMEDRYVCLEKFSDLYQIKSGYSFYGVFDGHSGAMSSSYAASQLPQLLARQLQNMKQQVQIGAEVFREAFEVAFLQADERFSAKRVSSGTTAVCALISQQDPPSTTNRHLYVAWVGDSKALLVGPKAILQLVKAHKPDATDERRRIESSGGSVIFAQGQWRVNGILNVARSIGDYYVEAVIAEPDFVDIELTSAHDFLVLGTDGLFDHVAETTVSQIVYTALSDATEKLENIPKLLIEAAKDGDSQDNITAILILLKTREQIIDNYRNV